MLPLWKDPGVPAARVPINPTVFISYILPLAVCTFLAAVLAVTHHTPTARVKLWLVICLLVLRAMVSIDISPDKPGQKIFLMSFMFFVVIRSLDWTLEKGPLVRHLRPAKSAPSTVMDALDLITNYRGYGWNFSHGMCIPRETRPTNNRIAFVFHTFLSLIVHAFICAILHCAILSFPGVSGSTNFNAEEPTIIDESLPFFVRYVRASIITAFAGFVGYASMQLGYDVCTIPAILLLGQDPAQWPPAFDAPWFATSLHDFWGRRWHQWHRRELVLLGGYPLGILFGPVGAVLGTFLASGIMHDVVVLGLDRRLSPWRMLVGFVMMGPGMVAERAFYRMTGRRVSGVVGWVWTMFWLMLFGGVMVEGCVKANVFGDASFIVDIFPSVGVLVERQVIDFDVWLHTI